MIFVTVGTHEQQFNRLVKKIDELKRENVIQEEVFIQIGFSDYEPKYCEWKKLIPYEEMIEKISQARIVITHGGPASFISVLQAKKVPVVVPRQAEFGEHVNNHQIEFVKMVEERQKNIIPVYDIEKLKETLEHYEIIVEHMDKKMRSNNENFNKALEEIVNRLLPSQDNRRM